MNKGQISILMSVYNCENTLKQSIDSILAQTYTNWEFIICNDCSTDGTYNVLMEYKEKYPDKFIIISNETNLRLAASLNHCLEYANGEYCARMDGDDYVSPDRFEKQVAFLKNHTDVQVVGTFMQAFNNNGLTKIVSYNESPTKFDLKIGPCFSHASIMMYTYVYKELGGYTVSKRTIRSQDYDLWFRFFAKGYCGANIAEPLYFVREDEKAFRRRKPKVYFNAVKTRWIGFRMLKYPVSYYPYILLPIASMLKNNLKIVKAKIKKD